MKPTNEQVEQTLKRAESPSAHLFITAEDVGILAAEVRRLQAENAVMRRHALNIGQDGLEGAYVETSILDAHRQALAEVAPDHPILKGNPPSFGVWESQQREIDALRAKVAELETERTDAHRALLKMSMMEGEERERATVLELINEVAARSLMRAEQIEELEGQRENWRVSSVAREAVAEADTLRRNAARDAELIESLGNRAERAESKVAALVVAGDDMAHDAPPSCQKAWDAAKAMAANGGDAE